MKRREHHIAHAALVVALVAASYWVPETRTADDVADTRFKYDRGFYTAPFVQVIRSRTPRALIRYTTDGSAPTETHGLGGENPVAVTIDTTTTLRALAYRSGMRSTNVDTQTYELGPEPRYGGNRNLPPTPFQFYMWDAECSLFGGAEPMAWIHESFRAGAATDSPDMVGLFHALRHRSHFMTLLADRVYLRCFHGGALTESAAIARWRQLTDSISTAVTAESARWGDARRVFGEPTRTRDDTFTPEVDRVVALMTGNVEHFIEVLRAEGYYPRLDPPELRRSDPDRDWSAVNSSEAR